MNRTAPDAPVTTTVSGLSDRQLQQRLKELTAVEHQLEVVVIDHLRELERRRLYLSWGFSSLFDYATRELGYSEAAAWRRIKAMRLCGEVEGARERMQDGSLTLNTAALLQNAFDRQERKQSGGGRGARAGTRSAAAPNGSARHPGAPSSVASEPARAGERTEGPRAAPVLDSLARQALVEEAAGKSTRQVENLLAGVDPELTVPADRMRPLGAGRWDLKAVIDDECRRGMEQLKGLLSHVDPPMTLGQLLGRVVREAVERHDPARPPRGRRTGNRAVAGCADETSAPKDAAGSDAAATVPPGTAPAGVAASPAKGENCDRRYATAAKRAGVATRPSAPKESAGPDAAAASARRTGMPGAVTTSAAKMRVDCDHRRGTAAKRPGVAARPSAPKERAKPNPTSAAKVEEDSERRRVVRAKWPEAVARSAAPAPTAEGGSQLCRATPAAPRPGPRATASDTPRSHARSRAIPAAAKRQVWERDQGCCSYVDRDSGRRCGSRHRLQIDHVLPYALGGSAEPDNLRLLCAAHHRHRHSDGRGRADRAARS